MTASFRWTVPPSVLVKALEDYKRRLIAAVGMLADFFAQKIAAYAKANARWTDRTRMARAGLTAVTMRTATAVTIVLYHSVFYGIFLELKNQGRFAIILESLERQYGPIMAALRQLVGAR